VFVLNSQLVDETLFIGEFPLCTALLMNNKLYPWVVLVPKLHDVTEIMDLETQERITLMEEIALASKVMKNTYWPDKLNIASLGNNVPQLHIHIIARFKTDDIWPEPVWGKGFKPYSEQGRQEALEVLRREFSKMEGFQAVANMP